MIKPTPENYNLMLVVTLELLEQSWKGQKKLTALPEYYENFISHYLNKKPYALFGGPSTLIDKIVGAIVSGGTNIELLTQGILAVETAAPGASSLLLNKLEEFAKDSDKAPVIASLQKACGIVRRPSNGAVQSIAITSAGTITLN